VEGETTEPTVLELRARQQRNFLATLFVSQGVPMLLHGDEMGRTQRGNNNTYCQDNEISWVDWHRLDADLLAFTRQVTQLRAEHPVFRRRRFFDGRGRRDQLSDIDWFTPSGDHMTEEDWREGRVNSVIVFLNGDAITEPGPRGERVSDDSFLLLFNAYHDELDFALPERAYGEAWEAVIDTADPDVGDRTPHRAGEKLRRSARSLLVLRRAG
jgi:isoamylase